MYQSNMITLGSTRRNTSTTVVPRATELVRPSTYMSLGSSLTFRPWIENYHDKYQVQNCQLENLAEYAVIATSISLALR